MKDLKPKNFLALALLIGVIGLFFIQILRAETPSKTELALFNILQLVFSVGFSWIISSYFSENSFIESQKKFAIGSFRRIKEIERSITRAQQLLSNKGSDGASISNENQPVMICLLSAQDAVNSSIADWGDIIGDEIHLTKEIARLKNLRKGADKIEKEYIDNLKIKSSHDDEIIREIRWLKSELPSSLQIEEDDEPNYFEISAALLNKEINETQEIKLQGFWDKDDSFSMDLSNVSEGDTLFISRGFTENRRNVLLAHDADGNWLGVITNKFLDYDDEFLIDYDSFLDLFEDCIEYQLTPKAYGGNPLPITVTKIKDIDEQNYQRFNAILKCSDIPSAT